MSKRPYTLIEHKRAIAKNRRRNLAATRGRDYAMRYSRASVGGPVKVPRTMNWNPGTEIKTCDLSNIQLVPGTLAAPAGVAMNIINQGAGSYNRIGRKISLLSYSINGSFQVNPAFNGSLADNQCRFFVVYDRQPPDTGAVPPYNEIYLDQGAAGTTLSTSNSNPNEDNRNRFTILESHIFYVPEMFAVTTAGEQDNRASIWGNGVCGMGGNTDPRSNWTPFTQQYLKRLNGLITEYKASTSTLGDITTGSLLLYIVSSSAGAGGATYPLRWQGSIRVRYIDV